MWLEWTSTQSIPADDHSSNDRRPATVEDVVCEVVVMGDEAPQWGETEEDNDKGRGQPLVTIWKVKVCFYIA